eukprot:2738751-Pyramimonas_sp.AAC.2
MRWPQKSAATPSHASSNPKHVPEANGGHAPAEHHQQVAPQLAAPMPQAVCMAVIPRTMQPLTRCRSPTRGLAILGASRTPTSPSRNGRQGRW